MQALPRTKETDFESGVVGCLQGAVYEKRKCSNGFPNGITKPPILHFK
jgi:hypothetical protein